MSYINLYLENHCFLFTTLLVRKMGDIHRWYPFMGFLSGFFQSCQPQIFINPNQTAVEKRGVRTISVPQFINWGNTTIHQLSRVYKMCHTSIYGLSNVIHSWDAHGLETQLVNVYIWKDPPFRIGKLTINYKWPWLMSQTVNVTARG